MLPELDVDVARRPLTRQPAFLVSVGLAVVAVAVSLGAFVHQSMSGDPITVKAATLHRFDENYLLQWTGPNNSYNLVRVDDEGNDALDISVFVRGREAWIPRNELTERTCLIIRSEAEKSEPVSIDPADLADQGAQFICVSDAVDG